MCAQCQVNTAGRTVCTACESNHELLVNECKRKLEHDVFPCHYNNYTSLCASINHISSM